MSGPNAPYTALDANQVLKQSFNETTDRLRVDATLEIDSITVNDIIIRDATNPANKLKVNADGSVDANVVVSHIDDSIRLGDGTNFLTSTTIGPKVALDVNLINGNINVIDNTTVSNTYNEVSSVANGVLTVVTTYTASVACRLSRVSASGTNIGEYTTVLNGNNIAKHYTYFGGNLNTEFEFNNGINLAIGDVVQLKVIHQRPSVGNFNSNILITGA